MSATATPLFTAAGARHADGAVASNWVARISRELWQLRQMWRTLRSMQTLEAQRTQQMLPTQPTQAMHQVHQPQPPVTPPPHLLATSRPRRPTLALKGVNFLVFQTAWFAAVLGAAHHTPLWGAGTVLAAIGWHLAASARPAQEARLVAAVALIGFCIETLVALQGHVAYPSGQPIELLAPYWMVALWALLAITLNVTLRWLKRRHALAALIGAVAGPASFYSGVQLGGARFVDTLPALLMLAGSWAVLLPVLMALSVRFDGVSVPQVPRV